MKLDDSQLKQVAGWFAAGERLADIQRRISEEFGIDMTYLDVRLLVADLPPPEEPAPAPEPESKPEPEAAEPAAAEPAAEDAADGTEPPPGEGLVGVGVTLDPITIPGTIASGTVTFSDGKTGKWYLDDMGRLGLGDLPEGYRPPSADAPQFQQQVVSLLRSKGLA